MSQARRKNKEWFDVTKDVSLRLNIPQDVIERVLASQFKTIKETIQLGELECVKVKYLGKFAVKPNRLDYIKNMSETVRRIKEKKRLEKEEDDERNRVEDSK